MKWGGPGAADDGDEALFGAGSHLRRNARQKIFSWECALIHMYVCGGGGLKEVKRVKKVLLGTKNGALGPVIGGASVRASW